MSSIPVAEYDELRDGENHPYGNPDIFNRACKQLWNTTFLAEHERDGSHNAALATNILEIGTYAGNGVDDRDISLTDGTIDIGFIRIFSGFVADNYFRSSDMAGDNTKSSAAAVFAANKIQSIATTGQFQVGDSGNVNNNGTTYYYVVFG